MNTTKIRRMSAEINDWRHYRLRSGVYAGASPVDALETDGDRALGILLHEYDTTNELDMDARAIKEVCGVYLKQMCEQDYASRELQEGFLRNISTAFDLRHICRSHSGVEVFLRQASALDIRLCFFHAFSCFRLTYSDLIPAPF